MKKNLSYLFIILTLYCGHTALLNAMQNKDKTEQPLIKTCLIKNMSNWALKVETENLGFALILRPNQSHSISTQATISITPYGEVWGPIGEKIYGVKKITFNQLRPFEKPLIKIASINPDTAPVVNSSKQTLTQKTMESIDTISSMITEKTLKTAGLEDYIVNLSEINENDRPTVYELINQSADSRYFLKLDENFKPAEIDPATTSLTNNISTLPDGTLKTVLTELATTATDILKKNSQNVKNAMDLWKKALEKAHKTLGKEIGCLITYKQPLSSFYPPFDTSDMDQKSRIYKDLITDLMWHLYAIAENKNQSFTEGTFVLIGSAADDAQSFLMDYVTFVNPTQKSPLSPTMPQAYPRISSHFKKHSFEHYGIDVGLILPENKQHILFGSIEPVLTGNFSAEELTPLGGTIKAYGKIGKQKEIFINRFFIKLENYGLSFKDITGHSLEFLISLKTKAVAKLTGESADDDPFYRKERIPMEFKQTIATIFEKYPFPESDTLKKEFDELGFQFLIAQIIQNPQTLPDKVFQALLEYAQTLRNKENKEIYDSLNLRFGREVIILEKDFCQQSNQKEPKLETLKSPEESQIRQLVDQSLQDPTILKNIRTTVEKQQEQQKALFKEAMEESPLSPKSSIMPTLGKDFGKNVVSSPYFQELIQKILTKESSTPPNQPTENNFTDWEVVSETSESMDRETISDTDKSTKTSQIQSTQKRIRPKRKI